MGIELIDVRCRITPETDIMLRAIERASGRDKSEIIREIMHSWARDRIEESKIVQRILKGEGGSAADAGGTGSE